MDKIALRLKAYNVVIMPLCYQWNFNPSSNIVEV